MEIDDNVVLVVVSSILFWVGNSVVTAGGVLVITRGVSPDAIHKGTLFAKDPPQTLMCMYMCAHVHMDIRVPLELELGQHVKSA